MENILGQVAEDWIPAPIASGVSSGEQRENFRISGIDRLLLDNANEGIAVVQDGRIKFVNAKLLRMIDYSDNELTSRPFIDFIHPDDRQMVAEHYHQRLGGEEVSHAYSFRIIDSQGNTRWAEINTLMFDWEGNPAALAFLTDITEQKKAEVSLRDSEARYRMLAENLSDVIWTMDTNLRYTYVSPSVTRLRGYSVEEAMAQPLEENMTPVSLETAMRVMAEEEAKERRGQADLNRSVNMEVELSCKDGSTVWVENRISYLRDSDGQVISYLGVSRDIGERRRAQESLKASEERFRALIENASDAIAILDTEGTILYESPSAESIFGHDPEQLVGRSFSELIHPDDVQRRASIFASVMEYPGRIVDCQLRVKHEDGSWRDVDARAQNLLEDPKVKGIVVNYRDITERKRAEEALRNSERHYRLLAENISDVIWVTNLDLRLTYISPSVTRLLGYSVEETLALRFEEILIPASAEIGRNALAAALTAKREDMEVPQTLEVEMKRKDGSTFWAESTHRFVWNEHGQPGEILGVLRDITERQETKERLLQTLKKLERTMEGTIQSISRMVETRDPYTAGHQWRVSQLACAMAREMGLKSERVQVIRIACLLHDLGKIGIPAEVLNKPGRLSEPELDLIKTHAQVGYDILKPVEFPWPIAEIVLQHHERLNGAGYPLGLHDEDISLEARILAVADVVEAMSSDRPYRPALGMDEALKEISHNSGILYDPDAVYACLGLFTQKGFKLDEK